MKTMTKAAAAKKTAAILTYVLVGLSEARGYLSQYEGDRDVMSMSVRVADALSSICKQNEEALASLPCLELGQVLDHDSKLLVTDLKWLATAAQGELKYANAVTVSDLRDVIDTATRRVARAMRTEGIGQSY